MKYDLSELKIMAEKYIAHFGNEFSAMELLRLTTEVFSEFPEDEFWLPDYVTNALREMTGGVNSRVNIRDNSPVRSPGSLAIMAAVIDAQFSRILELESTRGNYQARPGVYMHEFGANHYPHSRYDMPPMPSRPISPSSAASSASTGVRRYHRPTSPSSTAISVSHAVRHCPRSASPSSEKGSASTGSGSVAEGSLLTPDEDSTDKSLVRAAAYPDEGPADSSATFSDCDPAESSEDTTPIKVCISVAATEDGKPANEWIEHPESPVVEEHVDMLAYEESIVEIVEASVYEESVAERSVAEKPLTEAPVEVVVYEESVPEEPIAEELAWEEPAVDEPFPEKPAPEGLSSEKINTENNQTHPLLPNSALYADWKSLSLRKRRLRTRKLKTQGLPIPDRDGVISIVLA